MDQRKLLKVKLKSLAAEARIIRSEERSVDADTRASLHSHRVCVVRPEARATALAYGFLRGLRYDQIEPTARTVPDWGKVESMVKRYCALGQALAARDALKGWRP